MSKYIWIGREETNTKQNGFSLIEIIVAMGIITVSVVSILNLLSFNLKNEIRNKNKMIAIYLAQEGIEIVREIRDTNWFNGRPWGDGISGDPVLHEMTVTLNDENDLTKGWILTDNPSNQETEIYLHNDDRYYVQKTNLNASADFTYTGFTRKLRVKKGQGGVAPENKCDEQACIWVESSVSFRGVELAKVNGYLYEWYE